MASTTTEILDLKTSFKRPHPHEYSDYSSSRKRFFSSVNNSLVGGTVDIEENNNIIIKDKLYTQQQVDFINQCRSAEIARLRTEYDQYVMHKEQEIRQYESNIKELQRQVYEKEIIVDKINKENKILKHGIVIQNQQKNELVNENDRLTKKEIEQNQFIQRLEKQNYILRLHLEEATTSKTNEGFDTFRDVF